MSFVRWGSDSDVYVFVNTESLYFTCCACIMEEESKTGFNDDFVCERTSEMIEHLKQHIKEGHNVPDRALESLKEYQKTVGEDHRKEKKKRMRSAIKNIDY